MHACPLTSLGTGWLRKQGEGTLCADRQVLCCCPAEYFIPPEEEVWPAFHEEWIERSWQWLKSIGLREDLMEKVRPCHQHSIPKTPHILHAAVSGVAGG
jgi:hypothetical protein